MKSLYCIAGSLPAQFRSSQVDCGIGWKEHAKQEPRKAKVENVMPEIKEQLKEAIKLNAMLEASTQASAAAYQEYYLKKYPAFKQWSAAIMAELRKWVYTADVRAVCSNVSKGEL